MSSSYVSRETAEVGVAICIKPAKARNEARYLRLHGQYTQYTTRLLSMELIANNRLLAVIPSVCRSSCALFQSVTVHIAIIKLHRRDEVRLLKI